MSENHDCSEVLVQLYDYLDGELTINRRVEIEYHLRLCSPCLEAFDFEAELLATIRSCCRTEVPSDLRVRLLQVLEGQIEA